MAQRWWPAAGDATASNDAKSAELQPFFKAVGEPLSASSMSEEEATTAPNTLSRDTVVDRSPRIRAWPATDTLGAADKTKEEEGEG
jgi:hypothetical protein